MNTARLDIAASQVSLGLLLSDDLAEVARSALEAGYDSPSLRMLASLTAAEADQAHDMFARALAELRIAIPGKRDAVLYLAREIAKGMVNGTVGTAQGAKQIWDLSLQIVDERMPELDTFVYGASEWDDRPEDRHIFEAGIMAAAKALAENEAG